MWQRDWELSENLTLEAGGIWLQKLYRAGATVSWRAQTKPCVHQDPGERSSDPTRDWPRLACECPEVSSGGVGRWWPIAESGAPSVAVSAWDLLQEVAITFITSTIVWSQVQQQGGNTAPPINRIPLLMPHIFLPSPAWAATPGLHITNAWVFFLLFLWSLNTYVSQFSQEYNWPNNLKIFSFRATERMRETSPALPLKF